MKNFFKLALLFSAFAFLSAPAFAAVVSEPVLYTEGNQELQGYLYYDNAVTGSRPGVVVFHEWKGLGEYAKKRAAMLARRGYAAFAADMYGKGIFAKDHEEAGKLSGVYFKDRSRMRARALAALEAFKKTGKADPAKIAVIGYCFGGTTALEVARAGFPVLGAASFHGILTTTSPASAGVSSAKILVFNGADDKMSSAADIQAFEEEMRKAGTDWQFVNFSGAKHSFTVWDANMPEKGIEYNQKADRRSWAMLLFFLKEVFGELSAKA